MMQPATAILPERGLGDRLTALFWRRPRVLLALLLVPPLLWLGVVYLARSLLCCCRASIRSTSFRVW